MDNFTADFIKDTVKTLESLLNTKELVWAILK